MINKSWLKWLAGGVLWWLFCQPGLLFAGHNKAKEVLYWVAPMDPNFKRDAPGKSPMGMDLVPVYQPHGMDQQLSISPEVQQNFSVRLAKVERSRLWRGINTVGYVDYNEARVSHIHLRTSGWIEHLATHSVGERFKKGDTLLTLYSPELVNAQQEYVQALRSGKRQLINSSAVRLAALGLTEPQIKQLRKTRKVLQAVPIYAQQDGVVSELSVRHGMYVTPANKVMSLADLSSVWLLVDVFEKQANWVKLGDIAEVSLSYQPGKIWRGRVNYIYPSLDKTTRSLKVRLVFDNPEELLKPNMFAKVKILSGAKNDILVIPTEALIRTGTQQRVIVAQAAGKFEARPVSSGIESGDYIEILSGLDEHEQVVVSGQFLIDSEASLRASLLRMSAPQSPRVEAAE
ncbi:MAG: efflux RND transporter periplasmic adaptor subunit [Cycloclasticus sp.]